MKAWFRPALLLTVLTVSGVSWWLKAQSDPSARPLSSFLPADALLYLEARDFHALLAQWNGSTEKQKWTAGLNYDIVSRSRLLGRLQQAQAELLQTSGVSPEMLLLEQTAGKESAFAFYNLGGLRFVYLTRLETGRLEANSLWHTRSAYQPRQAGGASFFVKEDAKTGRTVAIASREGFFIVTTDESLMAATLQLMAATGGRSLSTNDWFQAVTGTHRQGDLRLVYNLAALEKTPQFRTYWIQQNQTALKQYSAGLSDLFQSASGFQEKRTLLRVAPDPLPAISSSFDSLVAAVPRDSSLYRAWANPPSDQLLESVQQVIRGEAQPVSARLDLAPEATAEYEAPAAGADLETKIDAPPVSQAGKTDVEPVITAFAAMHPTALLHLQSTVLLNDHVFVVPESLAAIACAAPDLPALEKALHQTANPLDPLTVRQEGNVLILARGSIHVDALHQTTGATGTTVYAAGYNHAAEWPKYTRLFKILDTPAADAHAFFSDNVQSLGDALIRLQRATLVRQDAGDHIDELVNYETK